MKIKLTHKLITAFMLVAIVPLSITGYVAYRKSIATIHSMILERLDTLAQERARLIESLSAKWKGDINIIAQVPVVAAALEDFTRVFISYGLNSSEYKNMERKYLPLMANLTPDDNMHDLFIISPAGDVMFTLSKERYLGMNLRTGRFKDNELAEVFDLVNRYNRPVVSGILIHEPSKVPTIFVATPVKDNKQIAGVIVIQIDMKELNYIASDYSGLKKTGETVIVTPLDDKILWVTPTRYDPNAAFSRTLQMGSSSGTPAQEAANGKNGVGTVYSDYRGVSVLAAWRHIPDLRLGLVIKMDEAEAFAPIHRMAMWFIFLGLASILTALTVSLFIAHKISKPITDLIRASIRTADGDLDSHLDISTSDEVGVLGATFNDMVKQLKRQRESMHRLSSELEIIIDNIPGLVFYKDCENRYIRVNRYVADAHNMKKEELEGMSLFELYPREQAQAYLEDDLAVINSGKPKLNIEEPWETGAGTSWVSTSKIPYVDENGNVIGVIGVSMDITQRKEDEKKLSEYRQGLENMVKEKTLELCKNRDNLNKSLHEMNIRNRINEVFLINSGEEIYSGVINILLETFKSPLGIFGHINEEGDLVVHPMPRETSEKWSVPQKNILFPRELWENSCCAQTIKEKKVGFSNKPSPYITDDNILIDRHITIPIVFHDRVIGIFQLANMESDFRQEDLSLMEKIALTVAPLLNARLEQDRQNLALMESENRYRAIFDGAVEGILVADSETMSYKFANPAMCRMLGYTKEEFCRMVVPDIHPGESLDDIVESFKAKAAGKKQSAHNIPCLHKDGTVIIMDIYTSPVVIDGRKCNVSFFLDATQRKLLENQLLQSQKLESIALLTSGIAHDFNNLLTAIIGNAEMALSDFDKENPSYELLDEIKKAGTRAASLTHQLLAFSRKQILQPEVLSMNDVVIELAKMLKRIIGENIDLTTILNPDLDLVKADPVQMEQIIMNLAVNARDAMPNGGKLIIETSNVTLDEEYTNEHVAVVPGAYVMLAVSDTGIGMNEEVKQKIFEPFYTTKDPGKGTGLGLSTVYGIVKQSNGNIWVYSEPGKGSTFKIYLPVVEIEGSDQKKITLEKEEVLSGSGTILLVDDDEMVRNTIFKILNKYGYTVLCASNSQEALHICRIEKTQFHLMLTDVVMPKKSGNELAEQAQRLQPAMKVLFMSGYTDNAILHHSIMEKKCAFIQKPFSSIALAKKIKDVLNKS